MQTVAAQLRIKLKAVNAANLTALGNAEREWGLALSMLRSSSFTGVQADIKATLRCLCYCSHVT